MSGSAGGSQQLTDFFTTSCTALSKMFLVAALGLSTSSGSRHSIFTTSGGSSIGAVMYGSVTSTVDRRLLLDG